MAEQQDEQSRGPEQPQMLGDAVSRRDFLKWAGVAGAGVAAAGGLGGVLAGCSSKGDDTTTTVAGGTATSAAPTGTTTVSAEAGRPVKVGWVTMTSGPFAGLSEPDEFLLAQTKEAIGDGLIIAGKKHPIEWVVKDSQSNSDRAAQVAGDLITGDKVDLIMVGMTPLICNPVSDQAEANGVPLISYGAPWQAWFFGRKGDPAKGFEWTNHFFWGIEDLLAVYTGLWGMVPTNKTVGVLWANDPDGIATADPKTGFPPEMTKLGYTIVDPGRYNNGTEDFSSIIAQFKSADAEILTVLATAPDFANFWQQAKQQGYNPKMATVARAILVRPDVEALGETGEGLCNEVWWSSTHPFTSSLTGLTCQQQADAWEAQNNKGYNASLGLTGAAFEVAVDALKRTTDVDDPAAIAAAVKATSLKTILGPIDFSKGPVPNVSKTPLVGGQWQKGQKWPWDLVVVNNTHYPEIPTSGTLKPMAGA